MRISDWIGSSSLRSTSKLTILCVVAALAATGVASAELAKWDQGRVISIAEKLVPATNKLYDTYYKAPLGGAGFAGADAHEFKDKIRLMHLESMHLAGVLKKGAGHDETRNVYFRIKELNDDASMYGRRTFLQDPTIAVFSTVEDLIRQLAPYYDKHWKPKD